MLPLLKWTGGKRKLVGKIKARFPTQYGTYYEPFVGGGALFFNLKPDNAYISDINKQLINFYRIVRDSPLNLLQANDKFLNEPDCYAEVRMWDRNEEDHSDLEWAARFLYLNKTAYSGMWRVNQKNQMNVPFAKYKSARLFQDSEKYSTQSELLEASELLNRTTILHQSYDDITPKKGDLIYLDPPYDETWTGYTPGGFSSFSQDYLADFCFGSDQEGVYFILSNNNTPRILEFYDGFDIIEVESGQSIRGRHDEGDTRKKVTEVLVTNIDRG